MSLSWGHDQDMARAFPTKLCLMIGNRIMDGSNMGEAERRANVLTWTIAMKMTGGKNA